MFNAPRRLRELLASDEIILRPAVCDPMMARIAQQAGIPAVGVSGFALGAHTCVTEPLLSVTEMMEEVRKIQGAVEIPAMVDIGAGFGEAIQVWRTVREMERARIAGVQMEDQVYPKRAHYHRDYREHTIDMAHMVEKITAAKEARSDPDFVIMARTDAMRTHGYDEAVRRGNAYAEAGADIVMIFPNSAEETERAPKDIKAPLVYVVSHGNRVGRPQPTVNELDGMGYKMVAFSTLAIISVYSALEATFTRLREKGDSSVARDEQIRVRKAVEDLIGLEKLYEIEERTTEKAATS